MQDTARASDDNDVAEAVGILGHRLNNILSVILGNATVLQTVSGEDTSRRLELLERAVFAGRQVAEQLQLLSGKVDVQPETVAVRAWLQGVLDKCGVDCSPDVPFEAVFGDLLVQRVAIDS